MVLLSYRLSALIVAAAVAVSVGAMPAMAQVNPVGPTVGPTGGVGSTTAPSNSQGTPAGGTGVIGTTRVGPSSVAPSGAPVARSTTAHRHRHHHRHARRATTVGTQSQTGLNNAAPASR